MINTTKTISRTAIAVAGVLTALPGVVEAQTAAAPVVGTQTQTLIQGFNYIGLTLHKEIIVSGTIDAVASNDNGTAGDVSDDYGIITENDVALTTPLGASGSATYILEITSGSLSGTIQEVTSWTNNTITIPDDLAAESLVSGTTYQIRRACTIADVFGPSNSAGLKPTAAFNSTEADLIYLPDGMGGFKQYYYSSHPSYSGWFQVGGAGAATEAIIYTDGFFIDRRSGSLSFKVSGSVKSVSTILALPGSGSYTYASAVYPEGSTLGNSGLSASVKGSAVFNSTEADLVYLSDGSGGFESYYYSSHPSYPGWYKVGGSNADATPLTRGIIIFRRGAGTNALLTPSSVITNL